MGDVIQFKRRPRVQLARGFSIRVDQTKAEALADQWGVRDRGTYRIQPTHDGTVLLEFAVPSGVVRFDLSVEDAEQLRSDIIGATRGAERIRQKARGADRWRATPIAGRDAFTVEYADKTATFAATKIRRARRCEDCRAEMPIGSIMYKQEGRSAHRWRGGSRAITSGAVLADMNRKMCRACMSPVVAAADASA